MSPSYVTAWHKTRQTTARTCMHPHWLCMTHNEVTMSVSMCSRQWLTACGRTHIGTKRQQLLLSMRSGTKSLSARRLHVQKGRGTRMISKHAQGWHKHRLCSDKQKTCACSLSKCSSMPRLLEGQAQRATSARRPNQTLTDSAFVLESTLQACVKTDKPRVFAWP